MAVLVGSSSRLSGFLLKQMQGLVLLPSKKPMIDPFSRTPSMRWVYSTDAYFPQELSELKSLRWREE